MHTTRPPRLARGLALLPIALTLAAASPVAAQGAGAPPADPEVARAVGDLAACSEAVERKKPGEAVEPGRRAEAAFRARVRRTPDDVEAIVGLARTITQCLLPSADFMGQGEMSAEAIDLLDRALERDPRHWTARFVQASIHYRSPAFLGRTPRAARELDELLRQQGDRNDVPRFARTFEMRGAIWNRAGRTDSALAVWRRGAALFPADSALRALVEKLGTAMPKPSGDAGRGASGEGRGASERTESPLPIAHSPLPTPDTADPRAPSPPASPRPRSPTR